MLSHPFGNSRAGFTLIEMIVVGAIVITGSVIAIPVTMQMVRASRGDSAAVMATTFLQTVRNRAVAERRNFVVTFPTDSSVRVERVEVPTGTLTVVEEFLLEGDHKFVRDPVLPDTPDGFGGIDDINFSGDQPVMFTSDGSLIDAAGDVTNGTIYISNPQTWEGKRAITVWGMTGLVRSWKWGGSEWLQ